jgi:excisionase family DNA binding protein
MGIDYLPLMEAAKYLGVSRVKLSQLARDGIIPFETSPLDKRVKLFKVAELDTLKSAPRWIRADEAGEEGKEAA